MSYRLAVDLGTAFTAAAAVEGGGEPAMLGLGNRTMQVPSVLYLADDGSLLVGEAAERRGLTDPNRLAREFKRRFGDPVPILIDTVPFPAELLTARLLRWVVEEATRRFAEAPEQLIVTHPANWGAYKRELLAGVVAHAEVPPARFCTEPEAAAVRYAARTTIESGERIAVYDLGGGTFDVCVLEKDDVGFRVLGQPDGVEHLGGADVDEAVAHLVLAQFEERLAAADLSDPGMIIGLARLRRDCVDAKEALSSDVDATVPVVLPGLNTTVRITRGELESAIRPLLAESIAAFRRTLTSAAITPADLRSIVLVGGSSRIPLVGELLQAAFRVPVSVDTHPKHDVVLGAALLLRDQPAVATPPRSAAPSVVPPVVAPPSRPPVLAPPSLLPTVTPLVAASPVTAAPVDAPVAPAPVEPMDAAAVSPPPGDPPAATEMPADRTVARRRRRPVIIAGAAVLVVSLATFGTVRLVQNVRADALIGGLPAAQRSGCQQESDNRFSAQVHVTCSSTTELMATIELWKYSSTSALDALATNFKRPPDNLCVGRDSTDNRYSEVDASGKRHTGRVYCGTTPAGPIALAWSDESGKAFVTATSRPGATVDDVRRWWSSRFTGG